MYGGTPVVLLLSIIMCNKTHRIFFFLLVDVRVTEQVDI